MGLRKAPLNKVNTIGDEDWGMWCEGFVKVNHFFFFLFFFFLLLFGLSFFYNNIIMEWYGVGVLIFLFMGL